jgi:nitroreductase
MSEQNVEKLIHESLQWRYATKRFDPTRTIPQQTWATLEESLHMAPSSFGLQPWHWIVITDRSLRERLQAHSWNQPQIVEASHLVVLASAKTIEESEIDSYLKTIADTRSIPVASLAGYRGMIVPFIKHLKESETLEAWTARQAYIALGMLLSSAAMLAIDTCPLEGIDAAQYDSMLGLTQTNYSTRVACALGYRSSADANASAAKVRYPRSQVFSYRS